MSSQKTPLPIKPPLDASKVSKILISAPGYESVEKIPYKDEIAETRVSLSIKLLFKNLTI